MNTYNVYAYTDAEYTNCIAEEMSVEEGESLNNLYEELVSEGYFVIIEWQE